MNNTNSFLTNDSLARLCMSFAYILFIILHLLFFVNYNIFWIKLDWKPVEEKYGNRKSDFQWNTIDFIHIYKYNYL